MKTTITVSEDTWKRFLHIKADQHLASMDSVAKMLLAVWDATPKED